MTCFKRIILGTIGLAAVFCGLLWTGRSVSALTMTPMNQAVSLVPGDTYTGRVRIYQQGNEDAKYHYSASIVPLSVSDKDNEYYGVFDKETDYTDIVNWITLTNGQETASYGDDIDGYTPLGEETELTYTIRVPQDARGGGHYFAVKAEVVPDENTSGNVAIKESVSIASVVYAEVAGDINISGSIKDNNVPGFLLNPPITTSFVATNDGNTHSEVTYYMQVFPLFSGEEIYTTEENPSTNYVLPGTTRYVKQTWDKTPAVGIFRVRQTVYYDSTDNEPSVTEKMVIVCPIWLIFIVVFVIAAIIIYFVARSKNRKKAKRTA